MTTCNLLGDGTTQRTVSDIVVVDAKDKRIGARAEKNILLETKMAIATKALSHLGNELHFPSAVNALRKIEEAGK